MSATNNKAIPKYFAILIIILAGGIGLYAVFSGKSDNDLASQLGPEFEYDLSRQRQIDPSLMIGRELESKFTIPLKEPCGIAVDKEDNIYVIGETSLLIFKPAGKLQKKIDLDHEPTCLAVADDGKIYLGLTDHVEIYDPEGNRLGQWPKRHAKSVLTSIAVYKDNVFVADAGRRTVWRYDLLGQVLVMAEGIGKFVVPSPYFDLTVASDGLLRVVNPGAHRIEAYTFDGDLEFTWGQFSASVEGFCGCCNPINFALMNDDAFVTCEKGLTRVKVYDANGKFVGALAGPEQFVQHDTVCGEKGGNCNSGGLDVAVDSQQRILVVDPYTNEVRMFSLNPENNTLASHD